MTLTIQTEKNFVRSSRFEYLKNMKEKKPGKNKQYEEESLDTNKSGPCNQENKSRYIWKK